MKKVLLVYEDYSELTSTEIYLKKIGFDVVGISNEALLSDKLLQFNPDVLVAHGKSPKVSTISVGQKMRENHRFMGKVILVIPNGVALQPTDMARMRMDSTLEAPISPLRMIKLLAKYTQQDFDFLSEKIRKATLADPQMREIFKVSAHELAAAQADSERVSRYKKMTSDLKIDTRQTTFNKQDIKNRQKDLKKSWDFKHLEDLDELKRSFADALFKKDSGKS